MSKINRLKREDKIMNKNKFISSDIENNQKED